ncbi:UDP-galactose transporter [Spiromyces aspiralis]|uniref:UDP-galactose transporter n=1 Tax=Spiromyces aspiralis TaxID=68401 RepID=A0ACC1HEZ2_9FUNG|nr:UDP-galactose transporter [Spiromyces aspiralis]
MLKLLICAVGIYTCFLTWGVTQERVVSTRYSDDGAKFQYFIVLNCIQAAVASLVALFYTSVIQRQPMIPLDVRLAKRFLHLAFLIASASPFGYHSLKHLNYVALTLAKSCKLVPVVVMNKLLHGRSYPLYKYAVVAMVTIGVSTFMLNQTSNNSNNHKTPSAGSNSNYLFGLLLILINLCIDGVMSATQDQTFIDFTHLRPEHMMCYLNLFSCLLMVIWLANPWNPELAHAIAFLSAHPRAIGDIAVFAICGAVGQCFIYYTIAHFGSLVLTTITVTRKLFTILISVVKFNHPLNPAQWLSIAMVFAGIGVEVYFKKTNNPKPANVPVLEHSAEKPSETSLPAPARGSIDSIDSTLRRRQPIQASTVS